MKRYLALVAFVVAAVAGGLSGTSMAKPTPTPIVEPCTGASCGRPEKAPIRLAQFCMGPGCAGPEERPRATAPVVCGETKRLESGSGRFAPNLAGGLYFHRPDVKPDLTEHVASSFGDSYCPRHQGSFR